MANSYQVALVGQAKAKKGPATPYAFHIEGYVSSNPKYFEATDDKDAFCSVGFKVNVNAWNILHWADGGDYESEEESNFITLIATKKVAERLRDAAGNVAIVSGPISQKIEKDKEGNEYRKVVVNVAHIAIATSGAKLSPVVNPKTKVYNDREYKMMCGVCGEVKSVGSLKQTKDAKAYLRLKLKTASPIDKAFALMDGTFDKDTEYKQSYCFVDLFGKTAEVLSKRLQEGTRVILTGSPSSSETDDGNVYYHISVESPQGALRIIDGAKEAEKAAEKKDDKPSTKKAPSKTAPKEPDPEPEEDEEEEEDLPF